MIVNNSAKSHHAVSATQQPLGSSETDSGAPKLVPAKFSDMYRAAVAAAVDADSDGEISAQEYASQITAAQGSAQNAARNFARLDKNADGSVSIDELAASLDVPALSREHGALLSAIQQVQAGMRTDKPSGVVLNAEGQVADPGSVLRYLVQTFPGNIPTT